MYTNIRQKKSNNRFFYMVLTVVAAVMVIALILSSPSFFVRTTGPGDTSADTSLPASTPPPDTSFPETEPDQTTTPAVTTEETTTSPVTTETDTETPPPGTTEVTPPVVSNVCLTETKDAGQDYLDRMVFLGDSTTYSFLYYGKLSGGKESTQVWTPKSRTLTLDQATKTTILYPETNEELPLSEALALKKPEILIITLGVNGISYMEEEYFTVSYEKLIKLVREHSPDTKIILQSIFPVATNWEKTASINNDKINAANAWILALAENCGVHYLDTISVLAVAENGYLPESYQNGDGLHLNGDACGIVLDYIRTHALPEYLP